MTDPGDTVLREALALPAEERAQVAADLLASLDDEHEQAGEVASSDGARRNGPVMLTEVPRLGDGPAWAI